MKTLNPLFASLLVAFAMAGAKPAVTADKMSSGSGKIYDGYLKIQQALAGDDFQKAGNASKALFDTLKAASPNASKSSWDSAVANIRKSVEPLAAAKNIRDLRNGFTKVAAPVAEAIEKFGMKSGSPAFLFHCPMHGPHGSDWLQKDKSTANPYFGSEMPECGSLVREVKKR
ncbi:MAG TPA: hypothetical protein DCQ83_02780 [Fibrobacteres bacterium]|jgi:hypothetical protein|nr:hypothetical protein [Fibrobacterota bacterium]